MSNELAVIFGTGPLGRALERELSSRGQPVRLVNRSGQATGLEGAEIIKGDAADPAQARQLCRNARVIYNCACPPYHKWPKLFPAIQAGLIEAAASSGAVLVSAENLYMYGPVEQPLCEDLPYATQTKKGRVRAAMAESLLEAHRSGKIRATIGRASNYYGPEVYSSILGYRAFAQALAGKKVNVLGAPETPHSYSFISDVARGLATLGERKEALGQVWHLPVAPAQTTSQMLEMIFAAAGQPALSGRISAGQVKFAGMFSPAIRETVEMLYEYDRPLVVDDSKYVRTFGDRATPHRDAICQTMEWVRHQVKASQN